MIPKKIHYCWFGGNPLSAKEKRCIKSWKKYCPDYEIICWNEKNFDFSNAPKYVNQAYEAKKWAFVSDYVRLYALLSQGGIYMDADVELVKPLDRFLMHKAFVGHEYDMCIATSLMGCEKDFPLFKEFISGYHNRAFVKKNGEYDITTNVSVLTNLAIKYGLKPGGEYQVVSEMAVYPKEYFTPIDINHPNNMTENTYAIHWFCGSWFSEDKKKEVQLRRKERKKSEMIYKIKYFPNRVIRKIFGNEKVDSIKGKFKG